LRSGRDFSDFIVNFLKERGVLHRASSAAPPVPVVDTIIPSAAGIVPGVYPMFLILRHLRFAALVTPLFLFAEPGRAAGGWMGFRNDTGVTLVIQETVGSRQGRPQKIFANETVRDTPPSGASRTFVIYESGRPDAPLHTGPFRTPADGENVLYIIKSDGKGGLTIEAVKTPAPSGVVKKTSPKR
jgi:hypothetical protein